jgi:RND family efflux transporter MFP subunit
MLPERENRLRGRRSAMAPILAAALLLLAGCGARDDSPATEEAPPIRPVKSMVLPEHGGTTRTFPGTVRATRRVDLSFNVPGKLIELPVKEGQRVRKGEVLARLDPEDYEQLVKAAQAEYEKALADYQRAKELIAKDYVSRADYDQTVAQKEVAAAKLERARKALDETSLREPFDGVVALRYVENYTDVRAKEPVLSLQDPATLEVVVDLPEDLVALYRADLPMTVTARFSALPGREFPLRVREFATQADPATRTYQVVFALADHEGVNLLPGMTAEVTITVGAEGEGETPVFTLPRTALLEVDGKQWVWVIDPQTHAVHRREVEADKPVDGMVIVRKGLRPGERIATAGVHTLEEGQVVKPVTEIRY